MNQQKAAHNIRASVEFRAPELSLLVAILRESLRFFLTGFVSHVID